MVIDVPVRDPQDGDTVHRLQPAVLAAVSVGRPLELVARGHRSADEVDPAEHLRQPSGPPQALLPRRGAAGTGQFLGREDPLFAPREHHHGIVMGKGR